MKGLRNFIEQLEQSGELVRITEKVSPELEISEIVDRVSKSKDGGKALLFENNGTQFPVLINMYGSLSRMCSVLRVNDIDDVARRIYKVWEVVTAPKATLGDKFKMIPLAAEAAKWLPKYSNRKGACQQVIKRDGEVDLGELPILKCWKNDGGRFITLPMVTTADPDSGARNVGMYRMQILGKNSTALHWHPHKTGAKHYEAWKRKGQPMPVAVCLGGDPVYAYSATAPLPEGIDEWILSGFIRNKPVQLVKCITNDLYVPADCDFVIEGYVDTAEDKVLEGPFGDHTGFYSLEDYFPRLHVTCITHRKDAVYPATLVGIPPQEDAVLGLATERIFLAPIRLLMQPEIADMKMPAEGGMHNLALVSIAHTYQGQGFKVASGLWGAGQMMFNKVLVMLPEGVKLEDTDAVAKYVSRATSRDIMTSRGPLDILDHAAQQMGSGGKICIDLTETDTATQAEHLRLPEKMRLAEDITEVDTHLADKWRILIIKCSRSINNLQKLTATVESIFDNNNIEGIKFAVVVDTDVTQLADRDLLWWGLANVDTIRDFAITRHDVAMFDARRKNSGLNGANRRWPNPTVTDRATIDKVDKIWTSLNIGEFIESPSNYYGTLSRGNGPDSE